MKYISLVIIATLFSTCIKSQDIIEMSSFTFDIYLEDDRFTVWYIIKPCFKYSDGIIRCETDSFISKDPKLKIVFPFDYRVEENWFTSERCYYKYDFSKCYTDSVVLYMPVRNFSKKNKMDYFDTVQIIRYSDFLAEVNEPLIYGNESMNDIIRFSVVNPDEASFYRISNESGEKILNCKKCKSIYKLDDIIKNKRISLSENTYNRLLRMLSKADFWEMDYPFNRYPKDFLIETFIDGNFHFVHLNYSEVKAIRNTRSLHRAFKLLKRKCQ